MTRAISVLAALVLVAGCAGSVGKDDVRSAGGPLTGLTVSGDPGSPPTVRMATPLRIPETRTDVTVRGTGAPVQVDQLFVLEVSVYDPRTGDQVRSTYDQGEQPLLAKTTDDTLFPELAAALPGVTQGSRLVLAIADADDPLVVVADVVAVPPATVLPGPDGEPVTPPADAPRVVEQAGDPVRLVTAGDPPAGVTVVPLVAGDGPKVRDHSLVDIDYLAQTWGSRVPFASTFFKEPALIAIGTRESNRVWDQALAGVRRGSRVLVTGRIGNNAPTAWVIDVLGVG